MFAGSLQLFSQTGSQAVRFSQSLGGTMGDGVLDSQFMGESMQIEGVDPSLYLQNQTQLQDSDLFITKRSAASSSAQSDVFKKPLPRRRVTASQSSDSQKLHFARRHEDMVQFKERSKVERANRVELLRSYRKGETRL
jgi:hypothetical protein